MHLRPCRLECSARVQDARCPVVAIPLAQPRERGKRRASGSAGPSGGSRGCHSTSPAISGRCCACSTSSSMRGTAETSTWRPRRSASPVPHPAALQPVSRPSLNYFAFRDSFGSSGCMVSSCDLGGDDSGGRGGGDRCAWSGTGQSAALPDRAAVTATRPPIRWAGVCLAPASRRGRAGALAAGRRVAVSPRGVVVAGVEHQRQPRDEEDRPSGRDEDGSKGGSSHVSSSVRQHHGRWGRHRPGPARSSATSSWPRKSRTCWVRSPARAAWAVHSTTTWWALWELFASP